MKNTMVGYYRPTNDEFETLWNSAIFVLDANVLLNLYRYPSKASLELLCALERLGERIWMPHYAGMEYQRNRLAVIADQKRKFFDVRNIVNETKSSIISQFNNLQLKKKHSSINIDEFILGFEELSKSFLENLAKLDEGQKNVSDEDEIRNMIDKIFLNKVGAVSFDQKALDDIYREGEGRYLVGMPPGYMDAKKEKNAESDAFQYGGRWYKRKFGDLILWKQIISHAKEKGIKQLIFLTDDEKEDWWLIVDSQGKKTIGPRPELVEEIRRDAEVTSFYMYNSEQFLQYSKQYLEAEISEESIIQVGDIKLAMINYQDSTVTSTKSYDMTGECTLSVPEIVKYGEVVPILITIVNTTNFDLRVIAIQIGVYFNNSKIYSLIHNINKVSDIIRCDDANGEIIKIGQEKVFETSCIPKDNNGDIFKPGNYYIVASCVFLSEKSGGNSLDLRVNFSIQ